MLLCVPEAEPLVESWREKGDPAAAVGLPPHVTLLYPFVDSEALDEGVTGELSWFFDHVDVFDAVFERVAVLEDGGVVYLDPVGTGLDDLAEALARRWPETPPFRGAVAQPHAHLTVVHTDDAGLREAAVADVQQALPLTVRVRAASLWQCGEDGTWSERARFPLADGTPEPE